MPIPIRQALELKPLFAYPNKIFKRISYFAAYLLLVLISMQAMATPNMLLCNSMIQSSAIKFESMSHESENAHDALRERSCHQHMATKSADDSESHSSCKSTCANLCALTAMLVQVNSSFNSSPGQVFDFNNQIYASIPQQNQQRPPISFI